MFAALFGVGVKYTADWALGLAVESFDDADCRDAVCCAVITDL